MAVYAYSEAHIESVIARIKRLRLWFCIAAPIVIVAAALLMFFYPDSPAFHKDMGSWLRALLMTLFVVPLVQILWRWRTWADKARSSLKAQTVDISRGAVTASYASGMKKQLERSEILRAEEPSVGGGLYLRTGNRYRWLLIPRKLDDYEAIKGELINMGIPIEKTSTPPNWEEYVGVLGFVSTILCALLVHNVPFLTVNLAVAVLLGFAMLYVINANPDNRTYPKMSTARFGAFLPAVFAMIGLVLAIYGWRL